ncbi:hypothetical protein [Sphingobium sp. B2]|uniref:hypothetical protein n=1 Tax=Sphingobium sp. B2 TaxID=2583228 RepID=UPI001C9748C4|nr:hypothetical protein [Sphingobium sp. B2]
MSILPIRLLAIVGVVATGGAFALWSGSGAAEAEAGGAPTSAPVTQTISELPLDRGYYVRTDATCATASNATAALLRRDGLYWSSSFTKFAKIEQTGPTTFRTLQVGGDIRYGVPPTPIPAEFLASAATAEWTITDRRSFSFKDSEGWEHEARLCEQRDMPADFRGNIAELIK